MDRDLVVLSPVKAQGSAQKRKWKGCKMVDDSKEAVSSRHSRTEAHTNSQRLQAWTRPAEVRARQIPALRRKSGNNIPSLAEKLFAIADC